MNKRLAAVVLAVVCAATLAACTVTSPGEAEMNKTAVAEAIERIPGVVSADVGAYNTGSPGSFGARVSVTVDEAGREAIGQVVEGAARAVAADPGDYSTYDFEVIAPDPAAPEDLLVLTLSRYRDEIPFPHGRYLGSTLTLTAEELAQVAAA